MTQEQAEMQAVSKEALLGKREQTATGFLEDWVPIPGLGNVHVRGLSRFEVLRIQTVGKNAAAVEQLTVSMGMLEPVMSEEDVKAWQKVSPGGELDTVTAKIGQLSKMLKDSAKQTYMEFEADPGSEFRSLPGGEAEHDDSQSSPGQDGPAQ